MVQYTNNVMNIFLHFFSCTHLFWIIPCEYTKNLILFDSCI